MNDVHDRTPDQSSVSRRAALALPAAGIGMVALASLAPSAQAANAAAAPEASLIPPHGSKLKALSEALAKAPRRRDFKSVPMILTHPAQWDDEALHLLLTYDGGPKQVWDNTDLSSPWLNLMRNSMNAQIWSFRHPDFIAVSATHGSAHLALYDAHIWDKYLAKFTGGKHTSNTWIDRPAAAGSNPGQFEDSKGVFSPHANSVVVLQQRGAVFCACHNEVWEVTAAVLRKGINPDKLSHEALAAEFTNHLIPGVVLTPGVVGTLPQFQLAGYHYAK